MLTANDHTRASGTIAIGVFSALVLILVCLLAFLWSFQASAAMMWGVTRHGSKCWYVGSMPSNIHIVYKFVDEESCKAFLHTSNGE